MSKPRDRYAEAGVDLSAAEGVTEKLVQLVESTRGPEVLSLPGGFGGLFDVGGLTESHPVLVSSTDSVGTKVKVAVAAGMHDGLGRDIVNHCINDILVCGARPLFFLDYLGIGKLPVDVVPRVVSGVAEACRAAGCALLGGETAEMPSVYSAGEYDLVGAIVGVVDREKILDGKRIAAGQAVYGLPSSGLHTNGYTLARKVLFEELRYNMSDEIDGDARPLGTILLEPHRSYLAELWPLLAENRVAGLVHITGGGFVGNIRRILPEGTAVEIDRSAWTPPPVFRVLAEKGDISRDEMYRVFNMGIGMVVIMDARDEPRLAECCPDMIRIGQVERGDGVHLSG